MRKFNRSLSAAILAMAVVGGGYAFLGSPMTPVAEAHLRDHPKLQAAFDALTEAEDYLKESKDNFHDHKEEAMHAIHVAKDKIALCVADEKSAGVDDNRPIKLEEEHHPKLHAAVKRLKEAREYLMEAKHDFRGHREEAVKAVDEAIHHIEKLLA
jgi:hypothetical protein